ncbi:MAG: DUF1405 domain-containing protein [Candidatus Hodarchaeota archaeon]
MKSDFLSNSAIRFPFAALNIGGALLVLYTNFWPRQMQSTTVILWPFIPDCAIAALLVAITLLWPAERDKLVQLMAALTCLQAGVSFLVIILDQPQFFTPIALASHAGLFLEGLVLMVNLDSLRLRQAAGGLIWLILNNLIDLTTDAMAYSLIMVSQGMLIAAWLVTDACLAVWTMIILQRSSKSNQTRKPIYTSC